MYQSVYDICCMVELNAALYLFDITISLARVGVEPTAVALTVAH